VREVVRVGHQNQCRDRTRFRQCLKALQFIRLERFVYRLRTGNSRERGFSRHFDAYGDVAARMAVQAASAQLYRW
jgi:hypothetical protein